MRSVAMKELGARWLTGLYDHMCTNPQLITNGFKEADILAALDISNTQVIVYTCTCHVISLFKNAMFKPHLTFGL